MKTCVLFSGGWDSAACALIHRDLKPDLLFISYGQTYNDYEKGAASIFAHALGFAIHFRSLDLYHDHPRRNFYLIAEAKRLGYEQIIVGSRNILPITDKYKDSNWLSLKLFGALMGVKVKLPVTGWSKRKIVQTVRKTYCGALYNCYNNLNDISNCTCVNCTKIKHLGICL